MKILLYNDLNIRQINGFDKLRGYLEKDDFCSADVKKVGDNLYRARLNRSDRLLFSIYRYKENAYALLLEYIRNHRYEKSRFLRRGIKIDEHRIPTINTLQEIKPNELSFLNSNSQTFNLLDKPITFDAPQNALYQQTLPLIIIGSAGSGKTCLMLEKIKKMQGDVLYISQSPYLVDTSKSVYQANNYTNNNQQVQFLSFKEFIESIKIPVNMIADSKIFQQWFDRIKQSSPIKDSYPLLEEIRGVITGNLQHSSHYINNSAFLDRASYLALGIKQSIFLQHEKNSVYDLFERYLSFITSENYDDINLLCHTYLSIATQQYDYIIIDEVQDLTNIQLALILKTLRSPSQFLFCGDANQVVHPNFFSWSNIKALFFKKQTQRTLLYTLEGNYRNATQVTQLANNILKLKTQRFGSLDKESHYLMQPNDRFSGTVKLLRNTPQITKELNHKTKNTTTYAIITLDETAKKTAQQHFSTPLIFTVQEAKGLEYDHIILFDFISPHETRYQKIAHGIQPKDLEQQSKYARQKDKTDKSAEAYKFHINALYVATTRAIHTIYWLETKTDQAILTLLGLHHAKEPLHLKTLTSSASEWQQQADTLERQGKQQQAQQIRQNILQQQTPDWTVYNEQNIQSLLDQALNKQHRQAKLTLFEYALIYDDKLYQNALIQIGFKPALIPNNGYDLLHKKYFMSYQSKNLHAVTQLIHRYGVDFRNTFNQTPLMIATKYGNIDLIHHLIKQKANKSLANNKGHNAFQIALYLAWKDKHYAEEKLLAVFLALSPDSMDLRINNQTIKLDKHRTEFFLINLMMVLFYEILPHKMIFTGGGFTPHDLIESLANFPSHLLYEKLYQHDYISDLLATHKMHNDNPHSLNLFYRVMPDNYLINPNISLKIDHQWVAIYDLLRFDQLSMKHEQKLGMIDVDRFYSGVLEDMKKQYKTVLGIV